MLGVYLGDTQARLTELLGPCETAVGETGVCIYWQRGLELELAAGRVQRMVAHRAGDGSALTTPPSKGKFAVFSQSIDEVSIGMTEDLLLNIVGAPSQRLVPLGKPAGADPSMWEYAKRGYSVEVETVDGTSEVVRVHVPLAPARPAG